MVPILGKPVMEYLIEHMANHGIVEIMVNVAYHNHKIEQYFGDGHRWGVQIGYSYEGVREQGEVTPKPMGSAGARAAFRTSAVFLTSLPWSCVAMR